MQDGRTASDQATKASEQRQHGRVLHAWARKVIMHRLADTPLRSMGGSRRVPVGPMRVGALSPRWGKPLGPADVCAYCMTPYFVICMGELSLGVFGNSSFGHTYLGPAHFGRLERVFARRVHHLPVSMHGLQATIPHGRFIVSRSCPKSTRSLKSTISNRLEVQERSMHLRRSHKDVEVVPSQSSLPTDHAPPHTMLEASASVDGVTEPSKSGHALSSSRKGSRDIASPSPWWKLSDMRVMGLEPSPELLAISMVYFVQGILGLSRLALQFFFKVRARAKAPSITPPPLMHPRMAPTHHSLVFPVFFKDDLHQWMRIIP